MDSAGWYSPIDRRMYPSILALCNSAVWKSWRFLVQERLDESRYYVFYRIDAARAEMVHTKIQATGLRTYRTLKFRKLFPSLERSSPRDIPCHASGGLGNLDYPAEGLTRRTRWPGRQRAGAPNGDGSRRRLRDVSPRVILHSGRGCSTTSHRSCLAVGGPARIGGVPVNHGWGMVPHRAAGGWSFLA